ncbi:MAG: oxidoreductase-like domain-containing protein [Pseudomonadota bacterium]|nr:oxidoreductase-like domain-containing protein [Pseudomonadota bacterium]
MTVLVPDTPNPQDPRPEPPEKPLPSDCCGSGCAPCVLEVYEDALERYQQALRIWESRQARRD